MEVRTLPTLAGLREGGSENRQPYSDSMMWTGRSGWYSASLAVSFWSKGRYIDFQRDWPRARVAVMFSGFNSLAVL
jgi:hypothetical protein